MSLSAWGHLCTCPLCGGDYHCIVDVVYVLVNLQCYCKEAVVHLHPDH